MAEPNDPAPQSDPQNPEPEQKTPEQQQPSEVESRIAEILGTQQELSQKVQSQESTGEELKSLIAGLSQKFDSLVSQKQATPTQPQPFGPSPTQQRPEDPKDQTLQQQVQAAVQEALNPILQQSTAAQQKLEKHKQVFSNLIQKNPELADNSSREAQLFHQIYNAREDLRKLDDAPSIIWGLVQGVRSQERAGERAAEEQKVRATMPASAGRKVPISGIQDTNVKTLQERFKQLQETGRQRPLTRREMGDFINLKVALAHANLGR